MERARVAVVGSFNVDLVFSTPRRPLPGETVTGTEFGIFIGGKGSNQAVAAARAGAHVSMVGRLGTDSFGRDVVAALENEGIDLRHVVRDPLNGTGVAEIVVEPDGTNSIVFVPRANGHLSVEDVRRARGAIGSASVLLLQLETPLAASEEAARIAKRAGATVVLNPAPAAEIPPTLLAFTDVLVPNETETQSLTGLPVSTDEEAERAARARRERFARGDGAAVLTLGARGALVLDECGADLIPPFQVRAVDTTAAGDAFCGAFAVALAEGRPLRDAVRFGSAAGALACTVMGAGPSLPHRTEIEKLLREGRS